jgi:gamma-glutamyl:cysteine ligase YbdK (ATP-grasp superfamily)
MRSLSARTHWARRTVALVALAALALVAFTGCGGDKESQQQAEQNLCTSLDDFAATIVGLQALILPGSSEDDLKSATDDVTTAWDQVVADAKDVKSASVETIQSSYEDLKDAIQNRPTDKPIKEVVAQLEPKLVAFAQAWKGLADGLNCK